MKSSHNQLVRREVRDLHHGPDFDRTFAGARNLSGNVDRLVEVPGVHQEVAAEVFARLREWTVGHEPLAVAHLHWLPTTASVDFSSGVCAKFSRQLRS